MGCAPGGGHGGPEAGSGTAGSSGSAARPPSGEREAGETDDAGAGALPGCAAGQARLEGQFEAESVATMGPAAIGVFDGLRGGRYAYAICLDLEPAMAGGGRSLSRIGGRQITIHALDDAAAFPDAFLDVLQPAAVSYVEFVAPGEGAGEFSTSLSNAQDDAGYVLRVGCLTVPGLQVDAQGNPLLTEFALAERPGSCSVVAMRATEGNETLELLNDPAATATFTVPG